MAPLLEIRDLRDTVPDGRRRRQGRRRGQLQGRAGSGARDRRRVRLRQERHLPDGDGSQRPDELHVDGRGDLQGRGHPRRLVERLRADPRRRDRDDLPGPDDVAEPGALDRRASSWKRCSCTTTCRRKEAQGAGARAAEGRRDPARRAPHRRLPAPVLRRHAAARDDRDGADQLARPAHRRRADDGARRDHAGADPRAARASCRTSSGRRSS